MWVRKGNPISETYRIPMSQGGGSLLIWGAVWIGGRSPIHIQRNTMNSERYVQVLENYVYPLSFELGDPSLDWIFMDDNARPHRSKLSNSFKERAGIRTLQWPARSPDLNPIENVWSMLKRDIRRHMLLGDNLDRLEMSSVKLGIA